MKSPPSSLEVLICQAVPLMIDVMGTQTAIAAQIHIANADYVLALKANHPKPHGQIKDWFEQAWAQELCGMSWW